MPFLTGLHPIYLVILLVIVLIIFGPGKLAQLGPALGNGISGFRRAASGGSKDGSDSKSSPE